MPIPTTNQNPALFCDLSQDEALAILSDLSSKHGPGVLAALLGAACAAEIREAQEACDPTDPEDVPCFDRGWLAAFAEHPAFGQTTGNEEQYFDPSSCEF